MRWTFLVFMKLHVVNWIPLKHFKVIVIELCCETLNRRQSDRILTTTILSLSLLLTWLDHYNGVLSWGGLIYVCRRIKPFQEVRFSNVYSTMSTFRSTLTTKATPDLPSTRPTRSNDPLNYPPPPPHTGISIIWPTAGPGFIVFLMIIMLGSRSIRFV